MNLNYFQRYVLIAAEEIETQNTLRSVIKEIDPAVQVLAFYDYDNLPDYLDRLPREKHLPLAILIVLSGGLHQRINSISDIRSNKSYSMLNLVFLSRHFSEPDKDKPDYFYLPADIQRSKSDEGFLKFLSVLEMLLRSQPKMKSSNETPVFRRRE